MLKTPGAAFSGYRTLPALAVLALLASSAHAQRRNVVLYVTDDQGDVAGCYGDPDARTPHLDALAAAGTRFANAFCTTASCSPSRAVMLSGRHGHDNGMYGLQHAKHHFESFDAVRGLPVVLAEAGWTTARIGKYHVAPEDAYRFEHALRGPARNPVAMASRCADFIAGLADDEPFFLMIGTSDPHRGGGVARTLPGTPDRFGNRDYEGVVPVPFDPDALTVPPWLPDRLETRAEWAQFHESVNRADQGLGRLVEILHGAGVWDGTLVIFVSDHGPAFPGAKTTVYEPGLRTACVVRNPEAGEPRVVETLVSLVDLMPTILDFCGVDAPGDLHGRSFLPWTRGETPDGWFDEVYASHTFHEVTMYYPMRVVRTPRYKLIWNIAHQLPFPFASDLWRGSTWQATLASDDPLYGRRTVDAYLHRARFELYDLESDPHESRNLADDPDHATTLADLQERLRAFQEATGDPWRLKWSRE